MCRVLGMMSAVPFSPAWGVAESDCSLLRQSNAWPRKKQGDGWGIGWYRGAHAQWFKSQRAVYDEPERLIRLSGANPTRIAIAQIRRASNPLHLSRKRLISQENAQPFAFKRYLFAHNGVINIPAEVVETLGPWASCVRGVNDSEVLFWLLVNYLEEDQSFRAALRSTVNHLWRVWERCGRRTAEPFTGLNVVFSDGTELHAACCLATRGGMRTPALCTRKWPFWQMCWRSEGDHVWVASEPLDRRADWKPLKPGEYFRANLRDHRINVSTGRLADALQAR